MFGTGNTECYHIPAFTTYKQYTSNDDYVNNISNRMFGTCETKQYGVATISRLHKIIGLFCKRSLLKRRYSAKETYEFKERTNRSHPISRTCI